MIRFNRHVTMLTATAMLAGCTATGGASAGDGGTRADQNRLVLTIVTGEGFPAEAEEFANAVAEVSGGSIEVKVDNQSANGDGVPDYEARVINYVADRKAELGFVAARAFDTVGVDAFQPLHAPFLIDNYELEAQVLRSASAEALLEGTRPGGVVGIGYVQGPLRRPLGYSRAFLDLADYEGARIGVRGSSLIERTIEALGATPVVFPPGDTTGLDGMEVHVSQIDLGKYDFGADSLTGNVVLWPRPGVIFANADVFDALTSDQQAILREAGRRNLDASIAGMPGFEEGFLHGPCQRGLAIKMAPDGAVDRLRAAVQPVYAAIERDAGAKAVLEEIEALRASVNAPPEAVECTSSAATPLPSHTVIDSPIVGSWTVSITQEEFQASPLIYDAGERNDPGNWGDFTLTFTADGRVTLDNPSASESTSGTYAIDGDHVVMEYTQGYNRGERFGGRWSIFRDTLTFERVPPQVLPTTYLVKAWTRSP